MKLLVIILIKLFTIIMKLIIIIEIKTTKGIKMFRKIQEAALFQGSRPI